MVNFLVTNWWLLSALFYMILIASARIDYVNKGYIEQEVGNILVWFLFGLCGPFALLGLLFGLGCTIVQSKGGGWINNILDKEIEIVSKKKRLKDELDRALYDDSVTEQGY